MVVGFLMAAVARRPWWAPQKTPKGEPRAFLQGGRERQRSGSTVRRGESGLRSAAASKCKPNASRGHHLYRLLVVEFVVVIGEVRNLGYSVAAASASVSRRRACSDDTLMFRRAATARGESCRFKASKVARTML
jgi:hypothetical protein